MAIKYNREKIGDGIYYSSVTDGFQKTNNIYINFITELSEDTAALNAVISSIISGSSREYPTMTSLKRRLAELYSAFVKGSVTKMGDSQLVTLEVGCINDRYALDGEAVTEEAVKILAGCLTDPHIENGAFYEKDFELKKQELIDDIEAEINEKRSFAFKRANASIYKDEPAALSAMGEKSRAEKITAKEAYDQYKKLIRTARVEIAFSGASDMPVCKEIMKDAFDRIGRDYTGGSTSSLSAVKDKVCRVTERYDIAQSKMVMAFKTDFQDDIAMRLMSAVYGALPTSKLFMNVREKLSLCYYCSSGYNNNKGVLYVDSGVEQANIGKAEAEILSQLEAVKHGDFTDEEIENARKARVNSVKGTNDSAAHVAVWYFQEIYDGKERSPEEYIDRLMRITREDIIAAANSLKLDTVYVLTGKETD